MQLYFILAIVADLVITHLYSHVSSLDISTNLLDQERLKATYWQLTAGRVSVCFLSTFNFKWIVQSTSLHYNAHADLL